MALIISLSAINEEDDSGIAGLEGWKHDEFFGSLLPLLSTDLAALEEQVDEPDGFEMVRLAAREKDTIQHNVDFRI